MFALVVEKAVRLRFTTALIFVIHVRAQWLKWSQHLKFQENQIVTNGVKPKFSTAVENGLIAMAEN